MRGVQVLILLSMALPVWAQDKSKAESVGSPAEELMAYVPTTTEGQEYFSKLFSASAEEARLVGEMIVFAKTKVPANVKESQRESTQAEALEVVEIWASKYVSYGQPSAHFVRKAMLGFPDEKTGEPTQEIHVILKGLKAAMRIADENNELDSCLKGGKPSEKSDDKNSSGC